MKNCLSCHGTLTPTKMRCDQCDLHYEGNFHLPRLSRLSKDHLQLAELFLLCGGNFRELSVKLDLSYPTVRKQIDAMIEELVALREQDTKTIEHILVDIEKGKRKSEEGLRLIREINGEY